MTEPEFRKKFFTLTDTARAIIITSHYSPDEDSIGSVLAMYHLLKGRARMIYTGTRLPRFESFTGYEKVEFVSDVADEVGGADLLIVLDANQFSRISKKPEQFKNFGGKTICLDHHRVEGEKFDLSLIDPDCPAAAALIFKIFFINEPLSKPIAEALLLGILGDTGNFSYLKPAQTDTILAAKKLIEVTDTSIQEFQTRYRTISTKALTAIKELLNNLQLQTLPHWPTFQTTLLTRDFIEKENYTDEEISEATHIYMGQYLTSVAEHDWGLIISPRADGSCRISTRSRKAGVNVRKILERLGVGSGHDQAAGGAFIAKPGEKLDPKYCLEKVLEWLKENEPN